MDALVILVCLICGGLILRPLLRFALPALANIRNPKNLRERVMVRYQGKHFDAWMFAWFKTGLDPMFRELPEFARFMPGISTFLDLGCGYGLAGCLLLEVLEKSVAWAVDPNPNRIAGAAAAMGNRGHAYVGAAPDFEQADFPVTFDAVFALDMLHFLDQQQLELTLRRLRGRLTAGGFLVIRCPVQPPQSPSAKMKLYCLHAKYKQRFIEFRSVDQMRETLRACGFEMKISSQSGTNPELHWFVTTAS